MMRTLLFAGALALLPLAAVSEPVTHPTQTERPSADAPMPAVIVLIVCKTKLVGPPDQNSSYTGSQNLEWATEHAMMVCRREEIQMYDRAVDAGAAPQPFTPTACQRSAMMVGPGWDVGHPASQYRFWRVACPVAIVNHQPDGSERIIAWKLPECGHEDTVTCLVDTAI